MATLRRWRRERNRQRSHTPESSLDIDNNYDFKINRYQKANWGDLEAKEAHASVVKYLWRKEYELNKQINNLKKQIAKQMDINASENRCNESTVNREISSAKTSNNSEKRELINRDIETPMRGIHFRTIEDKTFEKLNLIKSERKLANTGSYIEKIRSKANANEEDDISEDFKSTIRGKSAYQISAAILAEAEKSARHYKQIRNERCEPVTRRGIYDIMGDRNKLGIHLPDHNRQHQSLYERRPHGDHDSRWKSCDYLNLVPFRMQNDKPYGFKLQNHGEIIW